MILANIDSSLRIASSGLMITHRVDELLESVINLLEAKAKAKFIVCDSVMMVLIAQIGDMQEGSARSARLLVLEVH